MENVPSWVKTVVEQAKDELDRKSPYSFEYTPLKKGRKINAIKFYPVKIPGNVNEEFETERLQKQLSPAWAIERHILNYLKEHYMFSTPEIKNNVNLFEQAQKEIPDFLMFLSEVRAKANRAGNPKGYLINAMKKKMKIKTVYNKKKLPKPAGPETKSIGNLLKGIKITP